MSHRVQQGTKQGGVFGVLEISEKPREYQPFLVTSISQLKIVASKRIDRLGGKISR